MAVVKVFSPKGIKTVGCFDNIEDIPYDPIEEEEQDFNDSQDDGF